MMRSSVEVATERGAIQNSIEVCIRCDYAQTCHQKVLFRGRTPNRLMMLTDAPNASEERWGKPLVSGAGKWFEQQLVEFHLPTLKDWYITSAVKCRPPEDATPDKYSVGQCAVHLRREIALVDPEWIVTLGLAALSTVGVTGKLADIHGRPFLMTAGMFAGRWIFPTYDPGQAFRDSGKPSWLTPDLSTLAKVLTGRLRPESMGLVVGRGGRLVVPEKQLTSPGMV